MLRVDTYLDLSLKAKIICIKNREAGSGRDKTDDDDKNIQDRPSS